MKQGIFAVDFCSHVAQSGRLAQLGERIPYKDEVAGSIPTPPTIAFNMRGRSSVG